MVLATRISAPNTSLAVIRPKPRPDSPTASEISVIMLKSELPHEAPNPVSKKETRLHLAARRDGGGVAARGASLRNLILDEAIERATKNIVFSPITKTHPYESRSLDYVQIRRASGPERYRQASRVL